MTALEITPHWRIPLEEFEFTYCRSSGPGGQNVNKVSSKATLRWAALGSAGEGNFLLKSGDTIAVP